MKKLILVLVFSIGFIYLFGQKQFGNGKSLSFKILYGIDNNFFLNPNVDLISFIEGHRILSQKGIFSNQFDILIDYKFKKNHHFIGGLNFNKKGVLEEGESNNGDGTYSQYETKFLFNYITLKTGYQIDLINNNRYIFAIEAGLLTEYTNSNINLKSIGLSTYLRPNFEYILTKKINLMIAPQFASAILDYKKELVTDGKTYYPYSIGLFVGIKYILWQESSYCVTF